MEKNVRDKTSHDLLSVFDSAHRNRFNGTPAPIVGKKDGPTAARLLRIYDYDLMARCAEHYFIIEDLFIQRGGYTFGVFSACIGKIIQYDRRVNRPAQPAKPQPTAPETRAAQRRDEASRLTTQDLADDFYRKRPWLPHPNASRT